MPKFETRHKVRHAAADMFALVADVEAYPKFVPLCEALKVRGRQSRPDGSSVLIADMTVSYKVFRETFTSRVTLDPGPRTRSWSSISTAPSGRWRTAGPSRR